MKKFLLCIFAYLPSTILLYCIYQYGLNILIGDEYFGFDWDRFFSNDYSYIWEFINFHNEHRIFIPKIFYYLIAKISNVDLRVDLYFSFILLFCASFVFYNYLEKIKNLSRSFFVFFLILINFCYFSIAQIENFIWAFQVSFISCFTFSIISLYNFHLVLNENKNKFLHILFFLIFYILASLSNLQGLFVGFITQLILLLIFKFKFYKEKFFWFLFIVNLIIWGLYFIGFSTNQGSLVDVVNSPIATLQYFLVWISSPFVRTVGIYGYVVSFFIIFTALFSIYLFIRKVNSLNIFPISLILYALLLGVSVSTGRVVWGIEQAFASRYTTFSMMLIEGIILLVVNNTNFNKKIGYSIIFLIVLLFSFSLRPCFDNVKNLHNWFYAQQRVFLNYKSSSDDDFKITMFEPRIVKHVAELFEKNNAGPFYKSEHDSLLINTEDFKWYIDVNKCDASGKIDISGWIIRPKNNSLNSSFQIILKNISTSEWSFIKTNSFSRKEVTDYFHDGFNYDNSGFSSSTKLDNFSLNQPSNYEIYIMYFDNLGKNVIYLNQNLQCNIN